MKKFKSAFNGEILPLGFYEYRKRDSMYGFICAMSNEVIFITTIDGRETEAIVCTEFDEI